MVTIQELYYLVGLVGALITVVGLVVGIYIALDRRVAKVEIGHTTFKELFTEQKQQNKEHTEAINKNTQALIELKATYHKEGHA